MPTRITFTFSGDTQLDRTLARFDGVKDARPAWEAIARSFLDVERKQFASEGGFGSGGWPALSPKYAAWKARAYPGKPILVRTGDLKRGLTRRPFAIEVIEPGFAVLGTDSDVAGYHQHGGPNLPQRRPVELPESVRRRWVNLVQRFIVTGKV